MKRLRTVCLPPFEIRFDEARYPVATGLRRATIKMPDIEFWVNEPVGITPRRTTIAFLMDDEQ